MPHRTQFVAQVLLLAGMAGLARAQDAPQLVVSASEARLEIPLPYQQSWHWNLESTGDNELEYAWDAQWVHVADTTYAVGFYLFKSPGTSAAEGQLSDLIASGQASILRLVAGSFRRLEASVQADLRDDEMLVIRIINEEMLSHLFAARPDSALITSHMPGAYRAYIVKRSIPIRYDRS